MTSLADLSVIYHIGYRIGNRVMASEYSINDDDDDDVNSLLFVRVHGLSDPIIGRL